MHVRTGAGGLHAGGGTVGILSVVCTFLAMAPARASTEEPASMELTVVSFNTAAVPLVDFSVERRVVAIGRALLDLQADVVALQEVFPTVDRRRLQRAAKRAGLAHVAIFDRSYGGSGLMILSRYPIVTSHFLAYSKNGDPWRLFLGHVDWFSRKGVGQVRLETPMGPLVVMNTHCVSEHMRGGRDDMVGHRLQQMRELAHMVCATDRDMPVLVLGDLNAEPGSEELELLLGKTSLRDALPGDLSHIDYVLSRDGRRHRIGFSTVAWGLEKGRARGGGRTIRLSDHLALVARVSLKLA
ncbi:endonuclease/exonuclease/phosphatase family protein [Planctomycetota bacterium]